MNDLNLLQNEYCTILFNPERKVINGWITTPIEGDPAFYTRKARGIKKAWMKILCEFSEQTKLGDIISLLEKTKTGVRVYQ